MTDPTSSLIAAMAIPALVIDADERVTASNQFADDLVSLPLTGRLFHNVLRQPSIIEAIETGLSTGEPQETRFFNTVARQKMTWTVTVNPVQAAGGQGVLVCFQDITASREAEQMRRDFVANVSHELRTPLTALLGFIETLSGAARDDAAARDRFLSIMGTEAGRMSRLVEDLLSLSRVEEDQRVRPTDTVELMGLIQSAADTLKTSRPYMSRNCDILGPESCEITGDADQLRQVMLNLIENALKYGDANSAVIVRVATTSHDRALGQAAVKIDVTDTGDGIEPHAIGRLTERFFRVDSHRSREMGGTGLGLAIVKHIVDRHRGKLRISSEKGVGSTFSVLLPLG
ncbi:MAG: ATP-binding protein [Paracoccaceae bacterium]|nr:ATP-binding protein [Paracoccaceae bacterium]